MMMMIMMMMMMMIYVPPCCCSWLQDVVARKLRCRYRQQDLSSDDARCDVRYLAGACHVWARRTSRLADRR